ncbi:hypothetical protein ACN28C_03645 [Plantactinospora sp. WMMC1484]|uniref:hypothetical protein n=1 Tax=Plantactinospora sp. WMMC1484 TaxID=3404122 RepID=UPI003BF4B977
MFAMELVETAWPAATHALHSFALVTAAEPSPEGRIDTDGIVGFFATNIAPILLAVLGVIFIGRASKGEVSKVLTSSAIALLGLAFIAGAATLFFVGENLINLIFE